MHQLSLHNNHLRMGEEFWNFSVCSFIHSFRSVFFLENRESQRIQITLKMAWDRLLAAYVDVFFFVWMKEGSKIRHWFDSKLFADLTGTKWTNENEQQNRAHSTKWWEKKSLKCESTKCQNTSSIINLNQSDW